MSCNEESRAKRFLQKVKATAIKIWHDLDGQIMTIGSATTELLRFLSELFLVSTFGIALMVLSLASLYGVSMTGLMMYSGDKDNYPYIYSFYRTITMLCLFAGAISLTGFWGALKQNQRMLNLFSYCLLCVYILLVVGVTIVTYPFPMQEKSWWHKLQKDLPLYYKNDDVRIIVDLFQNTLQCCGIKSHEDWKSIPGTGSLSYHYNNYTVPRSCCVAMDWQNREYCHRVHYHVCRDSVAYILVDSLVIAGLFIPVILLSVRVLAWSLRSKSLTEGWLKQIPKEWWIA